MRSTALAHALAIVVLVGIGCQAVWVIATASYASWGIGDVLFTLVTAAVGWLIAWRRPEISLGWIMLAIAVFSALRGPVGIAGNALVHTAPGTAAWLLWYGGDSSWSWIPEVGVLFTQVPLRFPDGRLPSPRWRWFSRATVAVLAVICLTAMVTGKEVGHGLRSPTFLGTEIDGLGFLPVILLLFAAFAGSVASLFVRYRRAGAVERAQLRWVFWSLAIVVMLLMIDWTEGQLFGDDTSGGVAGTVATVGQIITVAAYFLIPISILVAVTRHGLYSIDRIISRTASYAIVTLTAVSVYGVIVLLAGLVLPDLKAVGVAGATLAAAAVFLPLLRLVRRGVDRRFNREQYDAAKVVDAFGERVRTGSDPQMASADLVAAVERTLQPSALGVWVAGDRP